MRFSRIFSPSARPPKPTKHPPTTPVYGLVDANGRQPAYSSRAQLFARCRVAELVGVGGGGGGGSGGGVATGAIAQNESAKLTVRTVRHGRYGDDDDDDA